MVDLSVALAETCFWLTLVSLLYCVPLAALAVSRRDRRTVIVTGICAAGSVIYGFLAFELGLVIAGI